MAHIQYPIQAIQGHKAHTYTQTLFKPFLYPSLFQRRTSNAPFKPSLCLTSFQRSTRDAQMTQKLLFYPLIVPLCFGGTQNAHIIPYIYLYIFLCSILFQRFTLPSPYPTLFQRHTRHTSNNPVKPSIDLTLFQGRTRCRKRRGQEWSHSCVPCAPLKRSGTQREG